MAHILIQSESDPGRVLVIRQDEDGFIFAKCPRCRRTITDRGHFEDTIEAASIHVDGKCFPQ